MKLATVLHSFFYNIAEMLGVIETGLFPCLFAHSFYYDHTI